MECHRGWSVSRWLGLAPAVFVPITATLGAGPMLQTSVLCVNNELRMTIVGEQLPAMKRISLTFAYDPSVISLAAATVSSPVPSTAFGALLDTAAKNLELNIVATSTFAVPDGATIAMLHAPVVGVSDARNGVSLIAASCNDINGATIVLAIGSVASRRPLAQRLRAMEAGGPTAVLTLNGRIFESKTSPASGVARGRMASGFYFTANDFRVATTSIGK